MKYYRRRPRPRLIGDDEHNDCNDGIIIFNLINNTTSEYNNIYQSSFINHSPTPQPVIGESSSICDYFSFRFDAFIGHLSMRLGNIVVLLIYYVILIFILSINCE